MKVPTSSATTTRMSRTACPGVRSGARACTARRLPTPSSKAALARNARLNSSSVRSEGLPGITVIPVSVPRKPAPDGVGEGCGGLPVAAPQVQEELRPESERLLREPPTRPEHQRRRHQRVTQPNQIIGTCRIEVRIPGKEGVGARILAASCGGVAQSREHGSRPPMGAIRLGVLDQGRQQEILGAPPDRQAAGGPRHKGGGQHPPPPPHAPRPPNPRRPPPPPNPPPP